MTLQLSGAITFTDIQTIFGGTNPIGMNEYYTNDASGFTTGIDGLPSTGSAISLQLFYGKSKGGNGLYSFSSHTFTNAGATGRTGPIISQVRTAYSIASWAQSSTNLNMTTQGIQEWTVPATGSYTITCKGAGFSNNSSLIAYGAIASGKYNLTKGEILRIVVGQPPIVNANNAHGGAGGSFVVRTPYNTLTSALVVAGGAGGCESVSGTIYSHTQGQSTTSGGGATDSSGTVLTAFSASIGYGGNINDDSNRGGGGGGLLGDGMQRSVYNSQSGRGGMGFVNGAMGGYPFSGTELGIGGFGGGGGSLGSGGGPGAGGGYSGGVGGHNIGNSRAGGGGSYTNSTGTETSTILGGNTSSNNGDVTITPNFTITEEELFSFTTHTFTNAGATGRTGPIISQVRSAYSTVTWAQNNSYLSMSTQGIQLWTVPATGVYKVTCAGARGANNNSNSYVGGQGAIISGYIYFTKGAVIKILVGQIGDQYNVTGGGGGGTFVATINDVPLIVAGGGGGAGASNGTGINASYNTGGTTGSSVGAAGINGLGSTYTGNGGWGQSGAGIFGNGNGRVSSEYYGDGVVANGFVNNGIGAGPSSNANGTPQSCTGTPGGFGGGGSGACNGGGGAGGYSGGGSGGGGGGSYSSVPKTNVGYNNSQGYVTITKENILNISTILGTRHKSALNTLSTDIFTSSALIFRASRDGWSASTFHSLCDNNAPIFIVFKSTNNFIVTAFTPVAFSSIGTYVSVQSGSVWLNNLENSSGTISTTKFLNTVNPGNTLFDYSSYGPTFGGGHDVYVQNNMVNVSTNQHSYAGTGYSSSILFGSSSTTLNEIEVYTINKTNMNPIIPPFRTHTFTNAGASGYNGPILSQVRSAYSTATWAQSSTNLNMTTQGIQLWTVPATGSYTITCAGAKGGNNTASGGSGAIMTGTFSFTQGDIVSILVGQVGNNGVSASGNCAGGGGGGTFVIYNSNPIIIAGGGGGAPFGANGGGAGNSGTSGVNGSGTGGTGGTSGAGATGGSDGSGGGNNGGGYSGNGSGGGGYTGGGGVNLNGKAYLNGGTGGYATANGNAWGGFGGGACSYVNGASYDDGGGGGGGYSGGGGGGPGRAWGGGGGGSLNNGSNQTNTSGTNSGDGYVTITKV